jgi:hypothetical protein
MEDEKEMQDNVKMDLRKMGVCGSEVSGTGLRSCSVVGVGIGNIEPLGSATTVLVCYRVYWKKIDGDLRFMPSSFAISSHDLSISALSL